ncbi:hypothetical protein BJX61DRAFT_525613 [Aspergillus egyptiacus]|nr:hypothetical protein BJX61DRAFT_525613 [Aspergillus egyptiacus]
MGIITPPLTLFAAHIPVWRCCTAYLGIDNDPVSRDNWRGTNPPTSRKRLALHLNQTENMATIAQVSTLEGSQPP